jgi:hypothetical protein
VLGGATVVLYGLVGCARCADLADQPCRFRPADQPDDSGHPVDHRIADFTWQAGDLTFTGIALGSIAALLVYHGMRLLGFRKDRELTPQTVT